MKPITGTLPRNKELDILASPRHAARTLERRKNQRSSAGSTQEKRESIEDGLRVSDATSINKSMEKQSLRGSPHSQSENEAPPIPRKIPVETKPDVRPQRLGLGNATLSSLNKNRNAEAVEIDPLHYRFSSDDEWKQFHHIAKLFPFGVEKLLESQPKEMPNGFNLKASFFSQRRSVEIDRDGPKVAGATFVEHCGLVFRKLRQLFDVSEQIFAEELAPSQQEKKEQLLNQAIEICTKSESIPDQEGNTGMGTTGCANFFYSLGGIFTVKILSEHEAKNLERILPNYYIYLRKKPQSLLERFCGLFSIRTERSKPKFILVSKSVFFYTQKHLNSIYSISPFKKAKFMNNRFQLSQNLANQKGNKVENIDAIEKQVEFDVEFLKSWHIIKYEIILAVHDPVESTGKVRSIAFDIPELKFVEVARSRRTLLGDTGSVIALDDEASYRSSDYHASVVMRRVGNVKIQYFLGLCNILQTIPWKDRLRDKFRSKLNIPVGALLEHPENIRFQNAEDYAKITQGLFREMMG